MEQYEKPCYTGKMISGTRPYKKSKETKTVPPKKSQTKEVSRRKYLKNIVPSLGTFLVWKLRWEETAQRELKEKLS